MSITTERNATALPTYTLITIDERGLFRSITSVDATSTVRRVLQEGLYCDTACLEVVSNGDVEYVPLVYTSRLNDRPELDAAIDRVLAAVEAAIAAERAVGLA